MFCWFPGVPRIASLPDDRFSYARLCVSDEGPPIMSDIERVRVSMASLSSAALTRG